MKTDKNIEEFTKLIMREATIEKPSDNFVGKVMGTVLTENKPVLTDSKPLISTIAWFFISLLFVGLSVLVFFDASETPSFLSSINWSFFNKLSSFNIFEKIHFSSLFTFSFVFFSALVILQLMVIKNYINKEIS